MIFNYFPTVFVKLQQFSTKYKIIWRIYLFIFECDLEVLELKIN